jgi:hypothetical protein
VATEQLFARALVTGLPARKQSEVGIQGGTVTEAAGNVQAAGRVTNRDRPALPQT